MLDIIGKLNQAITKGMELIMTVYLHGCFSRFLKSDSHFSEKIVLFASSKAL